MIESCVERVRMSKNISGHIMCVSASLTASSNAVGSLTAAPRSCCRRLLVKACAKPGADSSARTRAATNDLLPCFLVNITPYLASCPQHVEVVTTFEFVAVA